VDSLEYLPRENVCWGAEELLTLRAGDRL
jgi:hypothetical protein